MEILGSIITLLGSLFLFLGALGVLRMPDLYNRMQAGTKATTLGSMLFLIGIAVGNIECACVGKILLLILFIIFTNPVSSHALARAGHHIGLKLTSRSVQDDLAEDQKSENEGGRK